MFTPTKLVVLLTAALSVAAMPSHIARNVHNHREIAARVAQPEVTPVAEFVPRDISVPSKRVLRKRGGGGRCEPPSSVPSSTVPDSQPSPSPSPPADPQVVGGLNVDPPPSDPTTSPENQQPDPTTPAPAPTPTPTPTPDSGNSNSGNSNSGGGQTYSGQGTFYSTGLGACGITNSDTDFIAAVAHSFFDSFPGYTSGNPNNNPMCGKTAVVTYEGKTVSVQLTDRCEGCAYGDLDFSPAAFSMIANQDAGRISGISWYIAN